MSKNFEKMMEVVNSTFDTRSDPDQISVTAEERAHLEALHPATLSELADADGPLVWILLVPTTRTLMDLFLQGAISERELLMRTQPGAAFDVVYLCSASVLPEVRGKGLARKVCLDAVERIRKDHAITALLCWPFSAEGRGLARSVARVTGLPLHERTDHLPG
jgi:GNAT superfamily N-acetyltransferase